MILQVLDVKDLASSAAGRAALKALERALEKESQDLKGKLEVWP